MDWRLQLRLLLLTAALLAVAATAAASPAGSAAMPELQSLRRVEDVDMLNGFAQGEDDEAYPKRRVLQSGGHIGYSGLQASKAACYGPCPARGQPYTGRGCQQIFQCRGGR